MKKVPLTLAIAGGAVVFSVAMFLIGYYSAQPTQQALTIDDTEFVDDSEDSMDDVLDEEIVVDDEEEEDRFYHPVDSLEEISIDWFTTPIAIDGNDELVDLIRWGVDNDTDQEWKDEFEEGSSETLAYQVGTVSDGAYYGAALQLHRIATPGMGTANYYVYVIDADPLIILDRYSQSYNFLMPKRLPPYTSVYASDSQTSSIVRSDQLWIAELERELYVEGEDGNQYYNVGLYRFADELNLDFGTLEHAVTLADGRDLYFVEEDFEGLTRMDTLLVAETVDGRVEFFDVVAPFMEYQESPYTSLYGEVTISWDDDSESDAVSYYKGSIGGCGFDLPTNVVNPDDIPAITGSGQYSLGVDGHGDVFYPKYSSSYYEDDFAMWARSHPDASLNDFEEMKPFFYWTDQFGRYIEFQHMDLIPAAECGKPVIYLYPEESTDVFVEVDPIGGFTVTEPEYDDGWFVRAEPDGTLYHYDTASEYPYLFWEGVGGLYAEPEYYDVVAREDVERYLGSTLTEMGLNRQEIADFIEFWHPLMQEDAWYRIGWHGTNVMDALAPLTLSQQPDSVLRVFMDYEGLDAPISANPSPWGFEAFDRNGFSVVEWGGVLRNK